MSHSQSDWERRLNQAGHRVTRQRSVVLDAVCQGGGHTTLDDVTWRVTATDASVDRTTIARTLALFADVGIIAASVTASGATVYEVIGREVHHHLVCRSCGTEQAIDDEDLAPLVRSFDARYGFLLDQPHAMLFGVCRSCRG